MSLQPLGVDATPPAVHLLGDLVDVRTTTNDAQGAGSLLEVTTAPGIGAPPRCPNSDEESFYVLEGYYECLHEGHTITGTPVTHLLV